MRFSTEEAILIDGTDLIDGKWRLSDGRLMYLNWLPGEPNNKYEHWLMMNAFGKQNDIMRNVSLFFICERQLNL